MRAPEGDPKESPKGEPQGEPRAEPRRRPEGAANEPRVSFAFLTRH